MGGILISNSAYSPAAIAAREDALHAKTVVVVELLEIVQALTLGRSMRASLPRRCEQRRMTRTRSCTRSTRRRKRGDRRREKPKPRVRAARFGAARVTAVVTPLVLRDVIAEAL